MFIDLIMGYITNDNLAEYFIPASTRILDLNVFVQCTMFIKSVSKFIDVKSISNHCCKVVLICSAIADLVYQVYEWNEIVKICCIIKMAWQLQLLQCSLYYDWHLDAAADYGCTVIVVCVFEDLVNFTTSALRRYSWVVEFFRFY